MGFILNKKFVNKNINKGEYGLEMESLRIDKNGYLTHTKHPFGADKHIDRDFSENQIEMITDVCFSVDELYDSIKTLRSDVMNKLKNLSTGEEYLWQFSNPSYIRGENDIAIASFDAELKEKEIYREYLAKKYGKRKMLVSGIHLNFSFPDEVLKESFKSTSNTSRQLKVR